MKYHSLKMEEINDTMRHLWNKTYQGTGETILHRTLSIRLFLPKISDIDGIKIVSDIEGGVTKKTYNYKVNFTYKNKCPLFS